MAAGRAVSFGHRVQANTKQIVVITGCDSGLGFSLAYRLLKKGNPVVAGCLQPEKEGARKIESLGGIIVPLDVTHRKTIEESAQLVKSILENNAYQLQAVVNNAGVMIFGEFEWQTPRMIEQQVSVNILGTFNMAFAFLPLLQKYNGRLINVVSHCAMTGLPGLSVYSATKAAISNWSDTMRLEQMKYGVRVISFTPGSFYGQSGIMAQQSIHAKEMLENMSEEKRTMFGQYFKRVQDYLSYLPHPETVTPIPDDKLLDKLDHAVYSSNPKTHYKHEPARYTFYYTLFKLLPVNLRDKMVHRFVSLPPYESN